MSSGVLQTLRNMIGAQWGMGEFWAIDGDKAGEANILGRDKCKSPNLLIGPGLETSFVYMASPNVECVSEDPSSSTRSPFSRAWFAITAVILPATFSKCNSLCTPGYSLCISSEVDFETPLSFEQESRCEHGLEKENQIIVFSPESDSAPSLAII